MKTKSLFLATILFAFLLIFASCEDKNEDKEPTTPETPVENEENAAVNKWIYDEMSLKYYWNDKIPASSSMDYNIDPDYFFYRLLYNYNTSNGDRFSYLEKDGIPYSNPEAQSAGEVVANELGFEYQAIAFIDMNAFCITYVKKETDAEKAKLKRGDLIIEVDGEEITDANFRSLLNDGKSTYNLTIGNRKDIEKVTINRTSNYKEDPVHYNDIINIDGKKTGYIVYNFFASDSDDGSMEYAVEMNDIFKNF